MTTLEAIVSGMEAVFFWFLFWFGDSFDALDSEDRRENVGKGEGRAVGLRDNKNNF